MVTTTTTLAPSFVVTTTTTLVPSFVVTTTLAPSFVVTTTTTLAPSFVAGLKRRYHTRYMFEQIIWKRKKENRKKEKRKKEKKKIIETNSRRRESSLEINTVGVSSICERQCTFLRVWSRYFYTALMCAKYM